MIKSQAQLGLEKFRLAQPQASKTRVDLSSEDQKVGGRQTTEMQITFAAFFHLETFAALPNQNCQSRYWRQRQCAGLLDCQIEIAH